MTEQVAQTSEVFSFGWLGPDISAQVLDVYREVKSCMRVSTEMGCISAATVSRVVRAAETAGLLSEDERSGKLERYNTVMAYMEKFPHATISEIARLAGVSDATVYRAKKANDGT